MRHETGAITTDTTDIRMIMASQCIYTAFGHLDVIQHHPKLLNSCNWSTENRQYE